MISKILTGHQQAWVVFTGQADLPWLRLLKPGFRHCYVILHDGKHWLSYDPLSSYTEVIIHNVPIDFDAPSWLAQRGHTVVPAPLFKPKKEAPWAIFSCVEAVKRIIGLHNRFILTPWQLYCYLTKPQPVKSAEKRFSFFNFFTFKKGDLAWEV